MEVNTLIEKYFTTENIIELLTGYELYYQICLGNLIYETTLDLQQTNSKIKELHLQPTVNEILANIYEVIVYFSSKENFEERFDYYLRYRACLHALKDFVNKDIDLIQIDDYVQEKTELIQKDLFFTESMYLQFESNYSNMEEYFELLITDEISLELRKNFLIK